LPVESELSSSVSWSSVSSSSVVVVVEPVVPVVVVEPVVPVVVVVPVVPVVVVEPVVPVVVVEPVVVPDVVVEPAEDVLEESTDAPDVDPDGSAIATPGVVMIATPIPSAKAKGPTRPTNLEALMFFSRPDRPPICGFADGRPTGRAGNLLIGPR